MQSKNIAITIIVVIIIAAISFYGGTMYGKNSLRKQGFNRSGNNMMVGSNRQFGEQGQQNQQGSGIRRNGNGDGFIAGEIISKDEKSLTVKMPDGSSRIIFFSDSTTVGKSTQGSTSDLNTGEQVMANGTSNPDGSLSAQNIQIRPAQNQ